jgi:putative transcriptional regulator
MTIQHHPDDALLVGYAAGTLDLGQQVAVATHLVACPRCRSAAHSFECLGGIMLEDLPPEALSQDAFARLIARLDEPAPAGSREAADTPRDTTIPGLPDFVRGYRFGEWRWTAPGLRLRPIILPHSSPTRVFLLKAKPGLKISNHSHTGVEMTCVLTGAFRHQGGRFGQGDFDLGDGSVDHQLKVEDGGECICLIAMQGDLHLHGFLGRLMQPFLRM